MTGRRRAACTVALVTTAGFVYMVDLTVVNVALPAISGDVGADLDALQWVVNAYALAFGALVLTAGSVADRFGRRRALAAGMAVFTAASAGCALAPTVAVLDALRAVQGVGAALLLAAGLALLAQEFQGRARNVVLGVFSAAAGVAAAVGPLVGGVLVNGLGWRWIFWVNVPVGLAVLALAGLLPESRDPEAGRLDVGGGATFAVALLAANLALLRGPEDGWTSLPVTGLVLLAVAAGAAFVAVERSRTRPMLDLSLFRTPSFLGAILASSASRALTFGVVFYLTLHLQAVLGLSALATGVRYLPLTLVIALVAVPAGWAQHRVPARVLVAAGFVLTSAGLAALSAVRADSPAGVLLPGLVLLGAGIGLVSAPVLSTALGVVPSERGGMASGINNTFLPLGTALGVAVFGIVFQQGVSARLAGGGAAEPLVAVGRLEEAAAVLSPGDPAAALELARAAFVAGLDRVLLVGAGAALGVAVLTGWLIRARDLAPAVRPTPPSAPRPAPRSAATG